MSEARPLQVVVWTAMSGDKDFRNDRWTVHASHSPARSGMTLSLPVSEQGYQAFYVDVKYAGRTEKTTVSGRGYSCQTGMVYGKKMTVRRMEKK